MELMEFKRLVPEPDEAYLVIAGLGDLRRRSHRWADVSAHRQRFKKRLEVETK